MITIRQFKKNWRIAITGEEWEFKSLKEFKVALDKILSLKEKNGQLFVESEK